MNGWQFVIFPLLGGLIALSFWLFWRMREAEMKLESQEKISSMRYDKMCEAERRKERMQESLVNLMREKDVSLFVYERTAELKEYDDEIFAKYRGASGFAIDPPNYFTVGMHIKAELGPDKLLEKFSDLVTETAIQSAVWLHEL